MFDTTLFDRNAFDRSVSSDGIVLNMLGSSKIEVSITLRTPTGGSIIGTGSLIPSVRMQQSIAKNLTGNGNVNTLSLILRRPTQIPISSQGTLKPNLVVKTPIASALNGAGGVSINSKMFLYQNVYCNLSSAGALAPLAVFKIEKSYPMYGNGQLSSRIGLWLPLNVALQGQGNLALRRLGGLNENAIELIGINLLPGETITIDTDLLQVLVGLTEDVSSVTTESVFFELNPGENEIIIDADVDGAMEVVAIWQNRWL